MAGLQMIQWCAIAEESRISQAHHECKSQVNGIVVVNEKPYQFSIEKLYKLSWNGCLVIVGRISEEKNTKY